MKRNTIEFAGLTEVLDELKKIAIKNKRPSKTKQDLTELAFEIALNTIKFADDETFSQLNNLDK